MSRYKALLLDGIKVREDSRNIPILLENTHRLFKHVMNYPIPSVCLNHIAISRSVRLLRASGAKHNLASPHQEKAINIVTNSIIIQFDFISTAD